MKFGFQINLDVKDRPCLVVGGGDEATEKTKKLLDAGAKVTVISPSLSDERFEVFLEWLDAYRSHLQTTEPHVEKRAQLLRDAVAKVKLHAKIEFPKVEKKAT